VGETAMGEKGKVKDRPIESVGFVACYMGDEIASATSFDKLVKQLEATGLLGNKELVIKHTVPEGIVAAY
jgi:hypothetical protein